ncbi:hypothetical protein [Lentzea aerocolonigenes]|uniref:hypothetical protein n=1 Tax=Lentzea aerocolonigenes TaxID=68170 RepID=UPI0004C3805C|nr:hypothetical protein [Lentzea aerocolonigenes]MCP2243206.1 hypothetical protein [Lentzea aerocolonigenes]
MNAGQLAVLTVIGGGAAIAVVAALLTWLQGWLRRRHEVQRCKQIALRMAQDASTWKQNLTSEKKLKPVVPVRDRPLTGPDRRVVCPSMTSPTVGGHITTPPRHARAS